MVEPRRAVGYIRVSDESQAEQDKASLPEQERSIREYCERRGYELLEIFSDVGKRWDADRPGFKRMLAWGQESPRPFDVIVVWRADRIVGSASTVAALEPLLDRNGIDIEGSVEVISKGWLLLNALIAKGETEAKRHRGRLGIKTAVERGRYPGIPPYGRRWNRELKRMEIEETEARWYREMFAWSIAGDGDAKIAARLNSLGVPTRRQGKVNKNGKVVGKGWTASYVRKLLTDPGAYGDGKVQVKGGDRFSFPLPPVVDRETFEQALQARGSRRHFGQKATNRQYLISPRKGRCTECGLGFRLQTRSYRLQKKAKDGEIRCYERKTLAPALICRGMYSYPHIYRCRESKYVDFDQVQTAIVRKVSGFLATDDFALACAMPDSSEIEKLAARLEDARHAVAQTIREISFVVTEGRTGQIPKPVFDMQITQLNRVLEHREAHLKQVETEYQNASAKVKSVKQVMPIVTALKGFWEAFKEVTVSSQRSKRDDLVELPTDSDSIKRLANMLDILVERFTVDRHNNVSVELSLPVLESVDADALRCRQLANIPSP
jgi:DNA invertase Pin-like site-specific DNA recombinase/ribosomal protein L37E